ncbi:helix-turn-helix domain-containing protein [Staphylococcus warneri]|uniref:helix-turn-helix domain-containing protein n=1 Tax=Staphylococcus haemolyticus TaxID=1283 RepID=UPI001F1D6930|nr:helix-turn-helix domain-containing protein [Staphylococcus haemolyticus]MCE4988069.1 helix-turn-helix domain-containing protein [Staphylococcus haemolyticus]
MFNINIDEDEARELLEQAINERVDELARQKFFMSYKELAEYLNLSRPTVEELLIDNGLKFYRYGSRYLFKKSDVDAFMEQITAQMDIQNNDLKRVDIKRLLENTQ